MRPRGLYSPMGREWVEVWELGIEGVGMRNRWGRRPLRSWIGCALFAIGPAGFGCASSQVSDLNAYQEMPMNRVVPYPTRDELEHRAFRIVVVHHGSAGFDDAALEIPRLQVRRGLETLAADSGAEVLDRLPQDRNVTRPETILSETDGLSHASEMAADYALAVRFLTYQYSSSWKKPFKFLWETPEDFAAKPGTCTHTVDVAFDVEVVEVGATGAIKKTFALAHKVEQRNKDLDTACTIAPVTLSVLFETAIDESIRCLPFPLGGLLAPRGHITSHRKAPEADRHLFRISLGSSQGIVPGATIEIRREERAMRPNGEVSLTERVIAVGRVSDKVMTEKSWIVVDLSKATSEVLKGDIVRPTETEGLLASLSGPNCGSMLEIR